MRNVVTISHLDPELQEWLKAEAKRLTDETGVKHHAWQLHNTAIREFRERQENRKPAAEVSHG